MLLVGLVFVNVVLADIPGATRIFYDDFEDIDSLLIWDGYEGVVNVTSWNPYNGSYSLRCSGLSYLANLHTSYNDTWISFMYKNDYMTPGTPWPMLVVQNYAFEYMFKIQYNSEKLYFVNSEGVGYFGFVAWDNSSWSNITIHAQTYAPTVANGTVKASVWVNNSLVINAQTVDMQSNSTRMASEILWGNAYFDTVWYDDFLVESTVDDMGLDPEPSGSPEITPASTPSGAVAISRVSSSIWVAFNFIALIPMILGVGLLLASLKSGEVDLMMIGIMVSTFVVSVVGIVIVNSILASVT
jgi:hypothetical protein